MLTYTYQNNNIILYQYFEPWYHLLVYDNIIKVYTTNPRHKQPKELVQSNGRGYIFVSLGRHKSIGLHRLVAEAAYGVCLDNKEVNHIDGNKLNNHPTNLEYVTRGENVSHSFKTGLRKPKTGSDHHWFKEGQSTAANRRHYRMMKEREYRARRKDANVHN